MNMKVLVVIRAVGTVYGGTSQCILDLARSFGCLGIQVDIVTTHANGATPLNVPLQTWILERSYRIQYFPYWGWSDYQLSSSFARWLFQHVRDYDLVHTHAIFSPTNLHAYWACQQQGIPYVVTPHGMLEPWALAYKAQKKRVYYRLLEEPALNRASAIHLLTPSEAKGVEPLDLQRPLVVVPNGIHRQDVETLPNQNLFFQQFPDTQNKRNLLFLGRIDPKKGLDLLAAAFSQVRVQFPQTHLIIAGPDNIGFLPTVRDYFLKAGCLDAVTFTGLLTGNLKYAALAAAEVYVAPSYSEGFSLSILEGMAAGLPCIITTSCNFSEAETARAASVVECNVDAIANALLTSLAYPELAKEMGNRARKLVLNEYTWERAASKLIEVYQAILQQTDLPYCY
jgi:glycosyltransferase involved in cell wall biosynthesis